MGNFIDKTFTVIADILLKILPASKTEKEAFSYYRTGITAQAEGLYSEALENYYEALALDEDPYDRSYTLYNIGLIYANTGRSVQALEFYHQAVSLNSNLPQAFYGIGLIYHTQAVRVEELIEKKQSAEQRSQKDKDLQKMAEEFYDLSGEYWRQSLKLAPDNYPAVRNWLKITGRL